MSAKKFTGAPFGVQTARFDVTGVHPKSKMPGSYTEIAYDKKYTDEITRKLGPGSYNVRPADVSCEYTDARTVGHGWERALEMERMAGIPHLLYRDQYEQKLMLVKKLGPGSYEFKDFIQEGEQKPRSTRGICQTKTQRFQNVAKVSTPGPGSYGKDGIPCGLLEERSRKSTSTKGLMDGGTADRSLPITGCNIAPGTYNFKSSTQLLAERVVSQRGPYDVFSGDRNKPIIEGHLAAPQMANLGPGQYELKSFIDDLSSVHKKHTGKFGKLGQHPEHATERLTYGTLAQSHKHSMTIGPGQYNPQYPARPQPQNSPGFLSSAPRNDRMTQKFFTRNFNPVGAGRYDIQKWDDAQDKNGHTSVFKSKTEKYSAEMENFMKERIRGKDVPLQDRKFAVEPDLPYHKKIAHDYKKYLAQRAATVV